MKYFAITIFSIQQASGTHYGVPHDLDGDIVVEETTPVIEPELIEPESEILPSEYPFLP